MKTACIVTVCAVLGICLGMGITVIQVGGTSSDPSILPKDFRQPDLPQPGEATPRVEVDNAEYDFGAMERGTTRSHEFLFKNVGQGTLKLSVGDTTCKCAVGEVPDDLIEPGETVPVRLEWTATTQSDEFRQSATIFTNDPDRQRIVLTVFGRVSQQTSLSPPDLHFDKVAYGQQKTAHVYVLSHHTDQFAILGHEFVGIESPEYFDVAIEPAPKSEIPDPLAKAGYRVQVTVKETAPFGAMRGWLRIATNLENAEKIDIPLSVRITSDITVFGKGYNETEGVLRLGVIERNAGKKASLLLIVRGDEAADISVEVAETVPNFLIAELGAPRPGSVARIPLTVRIAPGAPAAAYMGGIDGKWGRIRLKTTHPEVPTLEIKVEFLIEDS